MKKKDTIPERIIFDLNRIFNIFEEDETTGCVFCSRYGMRIITSNPIINANQDFFGDRINLLRGAVRRSFTIDGANFITRTSLYLK
jgi:hypothetical protein